MAGAQKFSADLAATTLTDLTGGGIAAGDVGTYLFNFCNRTGAQVAMRLAITTGGAVTDADWLEYGTIILPNDILSRWPIPLSQGWKVFVYAGAASCSATLIGQKAV